MNKLTKFANSCDLTLKKFQKIILSTEPNSNAREDGIEDLLNNQVDYLNDTPDWEAIADSTIQIHFDKRFTNQKETVKIEEIEKLLLDYGELRGLKKPCAPILKKQKLIYDCFQVIWNYKLETDLLKNEVPFLIHKNVNAAAFG